jgi:hypothetical protein
MFRKNQWTTIMTRGILLFAIDTETKSYTTMAKYCAQKIKEHLNLPVALVTDKDIKDSIFDHVINIKSETPQSRVQQSTGIKEQWNNFERYQAYNLSPFDQTILIDTDYICHSNKLLKLFDINQSFLCHKRRIYLGSQIYSEIEYFGKELEMFWATVIYFDKSNESKCVFDMMKMIQKNYDHYSKLYRFRSSPYRNDYALSIALNTVYGHSIPKSVEIPWSLMNVEFNTEITLKTPTSWELKFKRQVENKIIDYRITTYDQDLHILNKDALFTIIDNK